MKPVIGILAGMGPHSTAPFIDLVIAECQRQYGARDDVEFPKILICSQPAPFYEDRPLDHEAMQKAILDGLSSLERGGADFLAIACNTAHIYYPQLESQAKVPLLDMVDIAIRALPATVQSVALLAARPTVESSLYQEKIRAAGLAVIDTAWQDEVDSLLAATREKPSAAELTEAWDRLEKHALNLGADAILVACLDLSGILPYAPGDIRHIDAAQTLACALIRHWQNPPW